MNKSSTDMAIDVRVCMYLEYQYDLLWFNMWDDQYSL